MIDGQGARYCADAYAAVPSGLIFDYLDCRAVLYFEADGTVVVAFRGTRPTNLKDWARDFDAIPERSNLYPKLGYCHAGFLSGGAGLFGLLRTLLVAKRVVLVGHSLGGALAVIVAGLLTAADTPPALLITFEAPKVGGAVLRQLLDPVLIRQYRFGNDPVTLLPSWLYSHVREPLVLIGQDEEDPFDCHEMSGILTWFANLPAAATAAITG